MTMWLPYLYPTAPNLTSGYVLMAPRSQLKRSRVSIEDAFKFHVSLGVMSPKSLEAQSAVFQVQKGSGPSGDLTMQPKGVNAILSEILITPLIQIRVTQRSSPSKQFCTPSALFVAPDGAKLVT